MTGPTPATTPAGAGPAHDPGEFAKELASQQASTDRRLRILLGAGASAAAGYPTLSVLGAAVLGRLRPKHGKVVDDLFGGRNLEEALTRARRVASILDVGEKFAGLDEASALEIEGDITEAISEELAAIHAKPEPYAGIAAWAIKSERRNPVEIFTLNYDTALEVALDGAGAMYFDGFVGTLRASFRPDLVDGDSSRQLPPFVIRLWKLHGSMNWAVEGPRDARHVYRGPAPVLSAPAAIYPSEEKYQASRRAPFVVLHDRFRRSLDEREVLLIVAGYSFGDQHLNEVIYDAALRNPRNSVVVFCHSAIPSEVAERAGAIRNLAVAGKAEAVWGGVRAPWGKTDLPGVSESGELKLADFEVLASYLASAAAVTP